MTSAQKKEFKILYHIEIFYFFFYLGTFDEKEGNIILVYFSNWLLESEKTEICHKKLLYRYFFKSFDTDSRT